MATTTRENNKARLMDERERMAITADLLRRGATLLKEPCPKCGGLQVRYQGTVYCVNHDDMELVLHPEKMKPSTASATPASPQAEASIQRVSPAPRGRDERTQEQAPVAREQDSAPLTTLLQKKLNVLSKELETTQDLAKQSELLELISKYIDTLSKLDKLQSG